MKNLFNQKIGKPSTVKPAGSCFGYCLFWCMGSCDSYCNTQCNSFCNQQCNTYQHG